MSMGTAACYADVIEAEDVKKIVPIAYKNFLKVLKEQKVSLEDFAQQHKYAEEENEKIIKAWQRLVQSFEVATFQPTPYNEKTKGLILDIDFHDQEGNGDRHDDVDGVFFTVDGMYEITPAGMKFNDVVTRKFYTVWV